MNTNNRNVKLQKLVVLLTVMEHGEDLIKKTQMISLNKNNRLVYVTETQYGI
jgi:hypothetical protein